MLRLLAIELHVGDVNIPTHRETCLSILAHLFGQENVEIGIDSHSFSLEDGMENAVALTVSKSKVLIIA